MKNWCRKQLASELRLSNFCLCYRDWRAFTYSAWLPEKWQFQCTFLVYRWVIAAYFFAWLFPSGLDPTSGGSWYFIFITNWIQLAWTGYLIVAALSVTAKFTEVHVLGRGDLDHRPDVEELLEPAQGCCGYQSDGTSWYQKIHWFLFTIGTDGAFAVSVLYWILVYEGGDIDGVDVNTHITNGVLAFFDLWFSKTPVHLYHAVYFIVVGAAYAVFTGIYYAAGGTNVYGDPYIYKVLNYEDSPGTSAAYVLVTTLVFIPFVHVLFYLQYIARSWITYTLFHGFRRRGHSLLDSESGRPPTEEMQTAYM